MKTPVNVIEDITAQIIEGKTLLESIYRESNENEKTDCYTACLLRSLEKTIDNARAYVTQFSKNYKHYKPTAPTGYTPNNLGNRIQIAREKLGLSEVDLAEKLDIHPGYVLTWEDGTDQPLAGMIIPLANALRCDPMWLLTGKSHHEPVAHTVMPSSPVEVMQNVDVSTIGKRIGVARVANHMNTQELEEAIGAPDGTVFRW
ncbi:helix-turn-helix domain-containing protein [Salmonella enterica subsp. enterica serovar Carrau]|nr:helix-turn-helix domain-containing protein [Salmonella enterica subsp. enterica serovar Carrau]HAE3759355.1 helix-turn-helix domain-containing protein [Salmonella enterica subsp. enterica serovar Carrau]